MTNAWEELLPAIHQGEWFSLILESMADAVIITDSAGLIAYINPAGERLTGWRLHNAIGRQLSDILKIVSSKDRQLVDFSICHDLHNGISISYTNHWLVENRSGRQIHIEGTSTSIKNRDHGYSGTMTIIRDITDRKLAETVQFAVNENIRVLIENAPVAVALFDRDMRYLAVSGRWLEDYKLDDSIIGLSHYVIFPEIPERWKKVHRRGLAGETIINEKDCFERADGEVQWLRWKVCPWHEASGGIGGIVIFAEDITERIQAEENLRQSEERFRNVFENATIGIAITDWMGRFEHVNPAYCNLLGYSQEELQRMFFRDLVPADDVDANLTEIRKLQLGEFSSFEIENRYIRKDGSEIWVRKFVSTLKNDLGEPAHLIALVTNVDERRRMENELRSNASQLAGLIDTAMDAIVSVDEQLRICLFNPAAEHMFGYSKAEILGRPLANLIPRRFRDVHRLSMDRFASDGGTARRMGSLGKVIGLRKNGEEFFVEASISKVDLAEGRQLTAILRDVTERELAVKAQREAEERIRTLKLQLAESTRHYIARQTAAAISHELNQPLTVFTLCAKTALAQLNAENINLEKLRYMVESANEQADRAIKIIRELTGMLHKDAGPAEKERLDIKPLLEDAVNLIASDGEVVTVVLDIQNDLPAVNVNRVQVEKALINLLKNAIQAMSHLDAGSRKIAIAAQLDREAGNISINIKDAGKGLTPKSRKSIFQPFFTTKTTGLGMGLAVSRALIESNGGKLWAEANNDGSGASFYIALPFI